MEGLEGLGLAGNAVAIPIVIAITQFLKKNFSFKYRSAVVSMAVTLIACLGLFFYNTPVVDLEAFFARHWIVVTRGIMDQLIIAFFTYLSASKSYDLFHGDKKKKQKVVEDKKVLEEEIVKLKNGNGDADDKTEEDPVVSDKLRHILEG